MFYYFNTDYSQLYNYSYSPITAGYSLKQISYVLCNILLKMHISDKFIEDKTSHLKQKPYALFPGYGQESKQ